MGPFLGDLRLSAFVFGKLWNFGSTLECDRGIECFARISDEVRSNYQDAMHGALLRQCEP